MLVGAVTGKEVRNKWRRVFEFPFLLILLSLSVRNAYLIHFRMCYLSDGKMEATEEGGFNTVECLRARLLAERHASKMANDEAESLGLKLIELENQLRQEIKFRERAERRLKFLEKKLRSFNISSTSGESERSCSSSEKCGSTFTTNSSSVSTDAEENEIQPRSTNSPIKQVSKDSVQTHNGPPVSKDCDCPQDLRHNPGPNTGNCNNSESSLSFSSSKSSTSPSSSSSPEDPPSHSPNLSSNDGGITMK